MLVLFLRVLLETEPSLLHARQEPDHQATPSAWLCSLPDWSSAHGFAVSPPVIKDKNAALPKAESSRVLGTANAGTNRYLLNVCREFGDADSASHPGQGGTQGRGPENHEGRKSKKGGRKPWEEAASSFSVAEAGWMRS